jgi:SAM-dependent methyltransferase
MRKIEDPKNIEKRVTLYFAGLDKCLCQSVECAIFNTYRHLLAEAHPDSGSTLALPRGARVLDAGCGHASLAGYLVSEGFGIRSYTGIAQSQRSLDVARWHGERRGWADAATMNFRRVNFNRREDLDALRADPPTGGGANGLDLIVNLETMCVCSEVKQYVRAVSQMLRRGGQWRVIDYFLVRPVEALSQHDRWRIDQVRKLWGYINYTPVVDLERWAKEAGLMLRRRLDLHEVSASYTLWDMAETAKQVIEYMEAWVRESRSPDLFSIGNSSLESLELLAHLEPLFLFESGHSRQQGEANV